MTKQEFYNEIETALEMDAGTIDDNTKLDTIRNWDSLAIVTLIAAVDAKYGATISSDQIQKCKRVIDLYDLVSLMQTA